MVVQHKRFDALTFIGLTIGFTIFFSIVMVLTGVLFSSYFGVFVGALGSILVVTLVLTKYVHGKQTYISMAFAWLIALVLLLSGIPGWGGAGGASSLESYCVSASGFYCSGLTYIHNLAGAGNLSVTVGQMTGSNWGNVIVMFALQGTPMSSSGPMVVSEATNTINGGLISGETTTITLSANSLITPQTSSFGSPLSGSLWVCYVTSKTTLTYTSGTGTCTAGSGKVYYTQIAILATKAV